MVAPVLVRILNSSPRPVCFPGAHQPCAACGAHTGKAFGSSCHTSGKQPEEYTSGKCKNCSLCETLGAGNKHSEIADIKTTLQTNQHEWQKRSGFKKQGTSDTSELISHLNQVE